MEQVKEMARIVYHALEDKKGEDICIIDIAGISPLADYFIITNGSSDSQDIRRSNGKGLRPETGCFWIMAMWLSMYLIRRTESSIIWSGSGVMESE